MARTKSQTELHKLLTLLRRIVVLAVGIYGLARELPYDALFLRMVILWAVLYIATGLLDVVLRRLAHQALERGIPGAEPETMGVGALTRSE